MEGVFVFSSVASTLASSATGAFFEAMIAAATIASNHGFHHILFLTNNRNAAQVFKKEKTTLEWLFCKVFCVPHVVVKSI